MKIDNSPARGMRDLLPADVAVRDHVLESIVAVYRRFGYQRIETPALEDIDRLQSGEGADNEKLIYQVLRRGLPPEVAAGTPLRELVDLGLRYDLTVPLTRFYGHNHASLPSPFRSLQVGPVWRAERPQRGRYRQFYQCDIDMIGEPSVLAEAELIEATSEALAAIGLTGTTIRLSDRRFLSALAADCGVPDDQRTRSSSRWTSWTRSAGTECGPSWPSWGSPRIRSPSVEEKIRGLEDLPAGKLAGALADAVPGLAAPVIEDLVATVSGLDRLAAVAGAELGVRSDAGARDGVLHRAGLRDHPPGHERVGGGRRALRQADRAVAGARRSGLRVLHRIRADRGPAGPAAGAGRGGGAGRSGRAGGGRARGGAGAAPAAASAVAGRVVETVRRSGKFGAQLKRLEAAGFSGFVLVSVQDGAVVRGELRALGGRRRRRAPGPATR